MRKRRRKKGKYSWQCLWCCRHDDSHCDSSYSWSDECRTARTDSHPTDLGC